MAFIATDEYWEKRQYPHVVNVDLYSPWVVPDKQRFFEMSAWCKENCVGKFKFRDSGHSSWSAGNGPMDHVRNAEWLFEFEEDVALFRLRFGNKDCSIYGGERQYRFGSSKK